MAVRHRIRKFVSLAHALRELSPLVQDSRQLYSGPPVPKFGGMLPRELVANLLLCLALNFDQQCDDFTFTTDPTGGDGIIFNTATKCTWPTEHVMVPPPYGPSDAAIEDRILEAIRKKVAKGGAAYAAGKNLVVFLEGGGEQWHPNRVSRELPDPLHFDAVWTVGLCEVKDGSYIYGVSCIGPSAGHASIFVIRIAPAFDTWSVERIQ